MKPPEKVSGDMSFRDGILTINRKLGKKTVRTRYQIEEIPSAPEIGRPAYRLTKENHAHYEVILLPEGWSCDCGDFQFRRGNAEFPCKHVAGILKAMEHGFIPRRP